MALKNSLHCSAVNIYENLLPSSFEDVRYQSDADESCDEEDENRGDTGDKILQ